MNVFHSFTVRSLLKNRSRTLVTLIGIILSMALFTAVIQGANSGLQFLIRSEEARTGAFHCYYCDITQAQMEEARTAKGVCASATWQHVGWADVESLNLYKPYLLIKSVSDNFTDLVAVNIISGRMPENEHEILLPAHLLSNGGVLYKVGDELTLEVGERTSDGYVLMEHNPFDPEEAEEISNPTERCYTVVGIYDRFNNVVEDFSCPGYTALTKGSGTDRWNLFFSLERPAQYKEFLETNAGEMGLVLNYDLLMFSGTLRDSGLQQVLYGFAGILVFLIAFGSVSLIYNSFSISVSERTRQFGILKSVGATKKQIRASVRFEALVLCAIAIPIGALVGCVGIGVTLYCLRDAFAFVISDVNVQMKLVISPMGLVLSSAACLITALISAWIPAKRTDRISAIDAIRQSKDVKLSKRDVRVSWLSRKLFGFEGTLAIKNFGRNRKRYRATVISLFLSVTLFISASSFCSYLTDTVSSVSSSTQENYEIQYEILNSNPSSSEEILRLIRGVEGVDEAAYVLGTYAEFEIDRACLNDEYLNDYFFESYPYFDRNASQFEIGTRLLFVDNESFLRICEQNGLDSELFYDRIAPLAIACDGVTYRYSDENDRNRWTTVQVLNAGELPISGNVRLSITPGRYWYEGSVENGDDETMHYFYPDDMMEAYRESGYDARMLDPNKALILTDEEYYQNTPLEIGAVIEDHPYFSQAYSAVALIYPVEMRDYVGSSEFRNQYLNDSRILIRAEDYNEAYDQINQRLTENGIPVSTLYNIAKDNESERMLITVINVFAYGFIILISLIAMANVFNTISTSISLRRREFAMLKSVGLTNKGFDRMMIYECLIYGFRGLVWGLPAAFLMSYAIYLITDISYDTSFYVPIHSIVIAVGSVFVVVFATMLYATRRIRRDNPIDALKNENL